MLALRYTHRYSVPVRDAVLVGMARQDAGDGFARNGLAQASRVGRAQAQPVCVVVAQRHGVVNNQDFGRVHVALQRPG